MWSQKHKKHMFCHSNLGLEKLVMQNLRVWKWKVQLSLTEIDFADNWIQLLNLKIHGLTSIELDEFHWVWLTLLLYTSTCMPAFPVFLWFSWIQTKPLGVPHRSPNLPDLKEIIQSILVDLPPFWTGF